MKMYKFDIHSYDVYYTIMAENTEQALKYLKTYLFESAKGIPKFQTRHDGTKFGSYEWKIYNFWKDKTLKDLVEGVSKDYFIKEFSEGEVSVGEYS